jgi:hypothetical protein
LQCCSNASLHRCSSTLPLPSPQSSRASCGMVTSDVALPIFVRWTFVRRTSVPGLPSSDFRPRTSVRWSYVRWSYVLFVMQSYALPSCGPTSCIIHNNTWYFSNCTLC